ncbi:type II secretion system F family protein [Phascolarctobacterium faecium]|uniref:type II secretion system F family protein n=1 Tax=Phascolarctobacterium faecium TaxID=33025 RepID=UPI0039917F13
MQLYRWRARSMAGKLYQGSYLADSKQEVAAFLHENYDYITGIEEVQSFTIKISRLFNSGKVNDKERSRFFQQLAAMIGSGIPLCRALELLKTRCPVSLTNVCCLLIAAMKKHVHIFRPVTVSVIEAGEQGGILQEMLSELAVYFGQKEEINRFLKNICLYPCLVLSLAIVTGCLFVVKLLPLFADLYQSFDLVPTLPLQVMMFVREIAVKYWQAAASLSLFILYYLWQRRYSLLKWCFCLPLIAGYRQTFLEIRFCKILSLLLNSGISLPVSIKTAAAGSADKKMTAKAMLFSEAIVRGSDITKAAALASPLFSSLTIEFLIVGESSGALATMLKEAALLLEQDFTASLKNFKVLLEPVLLIIISLVIGAMIFTVASPLLTFLTEIPEYE